MKDLSLLEFVGILSTLKFEMDHQNHEALEKAATLIETEAKHVIGTYDYGWPQLAEATQQQREQLGFSPNDPLLRTGDLRDSIQHTVGHAEAAIGSDDPRAPWQELGTSRGIPPRSFLVTAAKNKLGEVLETIGRNVVAKLSGTEKP